MLEIKYSPDEDINIEGDENSLLELCAALKESGGTRKVELLAESNIEPSPYDFSLSKILIRPNTKNNRFSVINGVLVIEGSKEFFLNLEANIPWDVQDPESGITYHIHYDRISFDDFLSNDSLEVILAKRRNYA